MQISLHIVVGPALLVIGMLLAGFPQGVVMMSAFGMLIVANAISRRSARTIPAGVRTVAQLVPFAGGVSSAIWTREEVLSRVIRITSEQLGIPVAKISEQSHFVHDLGAD